MLALLTLFSIANFLFESILSEQRFKNHKICISFIKMKKNSIILWEKQLS